MEKKTCRVCLDEGKYIIENSDNIDLQFEIYDFTYNMITFIC